MPITKVCAVCSGSSPDVKFSKDHAKCNKCRADRSRERVAEYGRRRRTKQTDDDRKLHAERCRQYREENPHLTFYATSRYHAKQFGCYSDLTQEEAYDIYHLPNICAYCAKGLDPAVKRAIHIDHIVPLRQGGVNSRWNLVKVCVGCNTSKNDRSLIDFYKRTDEFTQERYEAVAAEMARLSGRSREEIDAILAQSHEFEIAHERERQRLLASMRVFSA